MVQKVSGSQVPGVIQKGQTSFAAKSPAMGHGSVAFTLSKYASFVPDHGGTAVGLDETLGEHQEVIRTRSAMFSQHGKPPRGSNEPCLGQDECDRLRRVDS